MANVLVCDDERSIRELLEITLGQAGFDVRTAIDGADGLTLVRDWDPDCIILDIMMPKMNGLDVARALKGDDDTKGIPVLLLSAKAQASDVAVGMEIGADDYVTKPFDPAELLERVGDLLKGS